MQQNPYTYAYTVGQTAQDRGPMFYCSQCANDSHEYILYVRLLFTFKMTINTYHLLLLLVFNYISYISSAQILNCSPNRINFEKLIGIRPADQQKTLLHKSKNNLPVTLECLTKCSNNNNCTSFLLYYNSSSCYSFNDAILRTQNYDYDSKPDTNVVWFKKTCLNAPDNCRMKAWAVEIVAGATFLGYNTKTINQKVTRQQCVDYCESEQSFQCKSAKFNIFTYNREDPNPTGYCILSNTDRHLIPNAFRVSRYEDEYIENNCINTTNSPEYCAYEEYDNTILEHIDVLLSNMTQQQCQEMCDISLAFNCRGYSIVPSNTDLSTQNSKSKKYTCLLHSENSKLIGPKLLVDYQGAKYYERARCLNVSVSCTSNSMTIMYQPEQSFSGRIYLNGYSDTPPCYSDGRNNELVQLNIPLNGNICGIVEAHTAEPWNRTLKSALLVIQYNALILTQADRLIRVGCVYGNDKDDSEVTLGTSVNFTNNYPNRGSTVVNTSSVLPTVTMRIVDYSTRQPIKQTEIGEELQMIIEITPGNGPYDIWASNLIATSGNNTLQLLDDNGCPTSLNIFSPFTRIQTDTSRILVSNFQAFKFPESPVVRFSIMVHFCTLTCPPMQCVNTEPNENRIRRDTNFESTEQSTISAVNASVYNINTRKNPNATEEMVEEMPLDILLFVHGVNIASDKLQLAYGENNKILVAGYDIINDEVCLDYSLFVGLLVVWVLLQIIIVFLAKQLITS